MIHRYAGTRTSILVANGQSKAPSETVAPSVADVVATKICVSVRARSRIAAIGSFLQRFDVRHASWRCRSSHQSRAAW
jgi:hypothetical protein